MFDEVTETFKRLMNVPSIDTLQDVMPVSERFVVLMYGRSSICMNVNDARKELFAHKGRSIEPIPPTADALFQRGQSISQDIAEDSVLYVYQNFCHQVVGAGRKGQTRHGNPFGRIFLKPARNCRDVAAVRPRKVAGNKDANVSKLIYHVLLYANVVATVTMDNID